MLWNPLEYYWRTGLKILTTNSSHTWMESNHCHIGGVSVVPQLEICPILKWCCPNFTFLEKTQVCELEKDNSTLASLCIWLSQSLILTFKCFWSGLAVFTSTTASSCNWLGWWRLVWRWTENCLGIEADLLWHQCDSK